MKITKCFYGNYSIRILGGSENPLIDAYDLFKVMEIASPKRRVYDAKDKLVTVSGEDAANYRCFDLDTALGILQRSGNDNKERIKDVLLAFVKKLSSHNTNFDIECSSAFMESFIIHGIPIKILCFDNEIYININNPVKTLNTFPSLVPKPLLARIYTADIDNVLKFYRYKNIKQAIKRARCENQPTIMAAISLKAEELTKKHEELKKKRNLKNVRILSKMTKNVENIA